ncbi:50S ribosomal protein L21 [candidate division WWE3 bacterium]|nr:50S ribosomal protein L21 [candidate division WWE3 bacterium]
MEKYAIIKLGAKQFIVSEGDIFTLERQEKLDIDVLFYSDGKKYLVGEPFLTDIKVMAENLGEERARKIRVARFRSKSRHRRVYGHVQPLTRVKIVSFGTSEELAKFEAEAKTKVKSEKVDANPKTEKTTKMSEKTAKSPTKTTKKSSVDASAKEKTNEESKKATEPNKKIKVVKKGTGKVK